MAKSSHSDLGGSTQKMMEVNEAYEYLKQNINNQINICQN